VYRKRLVVRTKLTPPRLHKRVLNRPRVTHRSLGTPDYRLTIVQARADFDQSTALAALAESECPSIWYHIDTVFTFIPSKYADENHLQGGYNASL
jgi:ATP/maltotriose-dependent transcriptional regulator MalT